MPRPPRVKPAKSLLVKWSDDLALDLAAFSEAHYGAPLVRIVREAVRQFIDAQLKTEPLLRQRFSEARGRLSKALPGTIQLVASRAKPSSGKSE